MQALLSYDQSPPIAAPFRFFLTAPIFGVLAGLLLIWGGPNVFLSRWTPEALALTHLITAGFMLQVMLGALIQVLPVVAGANMARPLLVASLVHAAITLGGLMLPLAFLSFRPVMFIGASVFFIGGVVLFVGASALAMRGIPATGPTINGLKIAVSGLAVTVGVGVVMSLGLAGWFNLPLVQLADVHLVWGILVWGLGLLAAVAYVVVPMFQITPSYPDGLSKRFVPAAITLSCLWTLLGSIGFEMSTFAIGFALAIAAAVFAGVTLSLQRRSKRARFDTNQHCWRVAMTSVLAAIVLWAASGVFPVVAEWPGWPVLCGVLMMYGGFVSVITGMLYKIVPFLAWLHLQNRGQGLLLAPNMKKIIDEQAMHRQMLAHFTAVALLVLAVFWPERVSWLAGVAIVVSQFWLALNLWSGVRVFRAHCRKIELKRAAS